MENNSFVLKGNVIYSKNERELITEKQAYLVCVDGVIEGVFPTLPESYQGIPVTDCQDKLIMPGLTDLHLHAPQYTFRGLGMDMELLDWLNTNTFPEEAKYAELSYAKQAYELFADDLKRGATTRACIFATLHTEATELLMDKLNQTGLCAYVGRVNMDRNAPEYLCESSAEASLKATEAWIINTRKRYQRIKPIITPRFVPTCSDELLAGLSVLAKTYQLPVQSHLSENPSEIAWVQELEPWSEFYGDVYDHYSLFGKGLPTIMAHCVYSGEKEIERMCENGVTIAHCPQSNTNIASGIAPVRTYLDKGMRIGLGTDVAGGFSTSIFRAMADSIQVSKLRWRLVDETLKPLTLAEAFYMGTKGGGSFFGRVGSFENGYVGDVIVVDDAALKSPRKLSLTDRLERAVYMSEACVIDAKYVEGALLNKICFAAGHMFPKETYDKR